MKRSSKCRLLGGYCMDGDHNHNHNIKMKWIEVSEDGNHEHSRCNKQTPTQGWQQQPWKWMQRQWQLHEQLRARGRWWVANNKWMAYWLLWWKVESGGTSEVRLPWGKKWLQLGLKVVGWACWLLAIGSKILHQQCGSHSMVASHTPVVMIGWLNLL